MSTYLLTCGCGTAVPVEVGQAGEQLVCPSCGAKLDVPPLRKLRHLPVAATETERTVSAWGARQGVITIFAILAVVAALASLWNRFSEPPVPKFEPASYERMVDENLEAMTPLEAWNRWIEFYKPLAEQGFSVYQHPHTAAIEQYIARQRFFQKTLWTVAAICAAVAVAAALWPRSTARV